MNRSAVLHVDDSDDDRVLFRHAARASTAFELYSANDGLAAIEYLTGGGDYSDRERFPLPVLLLLDIKMPRKSGFDVLEDIRRQPGLQNLPIAVLSSSYDSADVKRAYALGARWYLMKPVDYDDVRRLVALVAAWVDDPAANDFSSSPYFKPPL